MKLQTLFCAVIAIVLWTHTAEAAGVLIFGGTGNTGSRIAKILVNRGDQVAVFVRPTSNRARLDGYDVQFVVGDVTQPNTVERAFAEVQPDVVVSVMQSRRGEPSPHGEPEIRLVATAERIGADQFVYLSSVAAGPDTPAQRVRYPDINFDLFADTVERKGLVEQALKDGAIAQTIIRTGSILVEFGREPPPGTGRAYMTEDQDVMGAVTYDDLAVLMARCIGNTACYGKTYHVLDDTLWPEYNHWRCRRFAQTGDLDAECDHLRPINGFQVMPRQ